MDTPESFQDLATLMDRLREPGGCPWDREQTYATLRRFLLEESYEVVEALDREDRAALLEELGDLLFQIVFLSRLAKEEGHFTLDDVVRTIARKMVRRHPHVFGDARADTPEEVLRHWEEIKRREKRAADDGPDPSPARLLDGLPAALPALLRAQQLGARVARVGFDWKNESDILEKIEEELAELRGAISSGADRAAREELGDLLFTVAMLARRLEIDPEAALEDANRKFRERFNRVETEVRRRGLTLQEAGLDLMDALWNETKTGGGDGGD